MRRRARTLLLLFAWLLAISVGIVWLTKTDAQRAPEPSPPVATAEPTAPETFELAAANDDASARALSVSEVAATDAPASTVAGSQSGSLDVLVVDARSGEPLPEIDLDVHRERNGEKLLARDTTDSTGRAHFDGLEANTILVTARRRPPHASAFAAAWLTESAQRELTLRMGWGVGVRGRVVDDTGAPIENADVLLDEAVQPRFGPKQDWLWTQRVEVRSGPDGRFRLDHAACEPREVWVERGAMAPRKWLPIGVHVRLEDGAISASAPCVDSDDVDLGDVVVPRTRTWAGIVRAPLGPAGGVLVTSMQNRWLVTSRTGPKETVTRGWPGLQGFELRTGEALTGADGSFELRSRVPSPKVIVRTLDGGMQRFDVRDCAPGERIEGLVLQLREEHALVLDLLDANGARVAQVAPEPPPHLGMLHPGPIHRGDARIRLRLESSDLERRVRPDPDGFFRVWIEGPLQDARMLEVQFAGYLPAQRELNGQVESPLRLTLTRARTLSLRLRAVAGTPQGLDRNVSVNACMLDPRLREEGPEPSEPQACCGLGAHASVAISSEPVDLELSVSGTGPYFVTLTEWGTRPRSVANSGPWMLGPERHEIDVPSPLPAPTPVSEPGSSASARVRVELRDADSGEPLVGHVRLWPVDAVVGSAGSLVYVGTKNRERAQPVVSGRLTAQAFAEGYELSERREIVLAAGEERDLGEFRLRALLRVPILVLGPDGLPAGPRFRIMLFDALGKQVPGERGLDAEGRLRAYGELPDVVVALALEESGEPPYPDQHALVEFDPTHGRVVRLAPWRRVELRVRGAAAGSDAGKIQMRAVRAEPAFATLGKWHALRELTPEPGARRFGGLLAHGRYTISARGVLIETVGTELEVGADGPDPLVLEIAPRAAPR